MSLFDCQLFAVGADPHPPPGAMIIAVIEVKDFAAVREHAHAKPAWLPGPDEIGLFLELGLSHYRLSELP